MSKNMYTNRNTHDTTMIIWENLLLPMTRLV